MSELSVAVERERESTPIVLRGRSHLLAEEWIDFFIASVVSLYVKEINELSHVVSLWRYNANIGKNLFSTPNKSELSLHTRLGIVKEHTLLYSSKV